MPDKATLCIHGLEVFAYHGCTPEEREKGQRFFVDIELEYDVSGAAAGDDLEKAVDYDGLASRVYEIVRDERYNLIETLAARIGGYIMDATPARALRVRVRKPEAPMERQVDEVVVEMSFVRDV
ncbi:MAG: dihydroneopterin aldolase [Actinomycetota bacterium]|nr:dihydroneopterin aldolase [Actinomycetota bacterium]